jgi:hypothetical protein
MEETNTPSSISPIESEIKKLFTKTEHLYKQLNRVLRPATEKNPSTPKEESILSDLETLNEKLGDILDRLQI